MSDKKGYLVFDIGTGNARVAVVSVNGEVLVIERDDIQYETESLYPDSRYFSPKRLWNQVVGLAKQALLKAAHIEIIGITSTSQRQGIVLLDDNGDPFLGLPNIDNRGREWEASITDRDQLFRLTGRLPSALFSGLKLYGLKQRQPELFERVRQFTSISEWVLYQLNGTVVYEPSQATETLLYDVANNEWSPYLCDVFDVPLSFLPKIKASGTVVGTITEEARRKIGIEQSIPVIVGGGDTQLAVKSTGANAGDIVVVSGTTTPIVQISDHFGTSEEQSYWTNTHSEKGQWLFETNPGITGLNYQKLKSIFYQNDSYETMDAEISEIKGDNACVSALGSYVSSDKNALAKGGFIFETPISPNLKRAHFVCAALKEIAFSVKWNYDFLTKQQKDLKIWGCGGGFQSRFLTQFMANLLNKPIHVKEGFEHGSIAGAAVICNETLNLDQETATSLSIYEPEGHNIEFALYEEWKQTQHFFAELRNKTAVTSS
ncbi:autoinducer 2 (AI-2) kinase [Fictibacillus solisalsi]|uniref:Autoinducer 2 (AI-2) kinase n=1 Tax=Fictibacillus solisalsi TaxID=459525 RepID=A0A1G9VEZ0_9BACL|nr:FGGY family carbohydrate kinase [Fictibacillus solisalsi]SDM70818.1 autoinducer 2 (AI-2) kinase [Fictibacillus solisalsi]